MLVVPFASFDFEWLANETTDFDFDELFEEGSSPSLRESSTVGWSDLRVALEATEAIDGAGEACRDLWEE